MFFKIGMISDIHTIVKWHRACNEEANSQCLRYAVELKEFTTTDPYNKESSGYSERLFFSEFSNEDMDTFYKNPIANEYLSMKILKKFKEFYKMLNKIRAESATGNLSDQLTLMQHMGYSIWLASSGALLVDGQANMFTELWYHLQPTIESSYTFKYEDIPIPATKELNFKFNEQSFEKTGPWDKE